jgi:hypothetical protein
LARKYETEPATEENFDEVAYLLANPDVAAAVAAGSFPSGRQHFDRHGHAEARHQVTAAAAPFTHYETRPPAAATAIEANTGAYLRCLIVKEALGIEAKFLLGDFVSFVATTRERFDAVIACGVLYHMEEPIALIDDLARLADTLLIWTHYFDDRMLRERKLRHKFAAAPARREHRGVAVELWEQHYFEALDWSGFCGGAGRTSAWLSKDGLCGVLERNGYQLTISFDDMTHPNGPGTVVLARRP